MPDYRGKLKPEMQKCTRKCRACGKIPTDDRWAIIKVLNGQGKYTDYYVHYTEECINRFNEIAKEAGY